MAMKKVDFEVKPENSIRGFWITVGDQDVTLIDGKGSADLDDLKEHFLIWWFTGDPGGAISIVGKIAEKTVVEIKNSAIPAGAIEGAGAERFRLKGDAS